MDVRTFVGVACCVRARVRVLCALVRVLCARVLCALVRVCVVCVCVCVRVRRLVTAPAAVPCTSLQASRSRRHGEPRLLRACLVTGLKVRARWDRLLQRRLIRLHSPFLTSASRSIRFAGGGGGARARACVYVCVSMSVRL